MEIVKGDLDDPKIVALLEHHIVSAREVTDPGSAHALDVAGLKAPDVEFWAIWRDGEPLAVGALKRLDATHGEVKSMHTARTARRSGAGSAMLRHIIAAARAHGLARLSLETGSMAYFDPAVAMYRKHGFTNCPPFAGYREDPNSLYLTLELR